MFSETKVICNLRLTIVFEKDRLLNELEKLEIAREVNRNIHSLLFIM